MEEENALRRKLQTLNNDYSRNRSRDMSNKRSHPRNNGFKSRENNRNVRNHKRVKPNTSVLLTTERKPRSVGKEGQDRSKRMFGALMGHLGKARKAIEKDSDLLKKQNSRVSQVDLKDQQEAKRLKELEEKNSVFDRIRDTRRKLKLDKEREITRLQLKQLRWVKAETCFARFIQTTSSYPPLYYLPAKHTTNTKALVEASVEALEVKMEAKQRKEDACIAKIEAEFELKMKKCDQEESEHELKIKQKAGENSLKEEQMEEPMLGDAGSCIENRSEATEEAKVNKVDIQSDAAKEKKEDIQSNAAKEKEEDFESDAAKEKEKDIQSDTAKEKEEEIQSDTAKENEKVGFNDATAAVKEDDKELEVDYEDDKSIDSTEMNVEQVQTPNAKVKVVKDDAFLTPANLKVVQLRAELKKRGLNTGGLKAALVKRLTEATSQE